MSIEQSLGVKLNLMTNFAGASKEAAASLRSIGTELETIKKAGAGFQLQGLKDLSEQITSLNQRASAAAKKVADLSGGFGGVNATSRTAATGMNEAASAASRVEAAASSAASQVLRLSTSLGSLGAMEVDKVGNAMHGVQTEAYQAKRAVDELEASMLRLGTTSARALNPGVTSGESQRFTTVGPTRYGPIPAASGYSESRVSLPPGGVPMLTGGTDPYFNARAWWANQRAQGGSSGGGPPIGVPPGGFGSGGGGGGGFNFGSFGKGMSRVGGDISSAGMAGAFNAAMISSIVVPGLKNAADNADLMARNVEAYLAGGGTKAAADKFNKALIKIARQTGANFTDTIGAGYNFISAAPFGVDLSNPAYAKVVAEGYKRTAMMQVAGTSSRHHVSMEEAALDVNNVIANLGLDTSSPKKLADAYRVATNVLINLKNRTSTEIDMAAQSFKAVGPIAKQFGIAPEEITAFIAMEAEGKIRGGPAGMNLKRLLVRQAAPSGKLAKLIAFTQTVAKKEGLDPSGISLFDEHGKTRSLFDMLSSIQVFQEKNHLKQSENAFIDAQVSGLYAIAGIELSKDQMKKHGGAHQARQYGHDLMNKTIKGGKTGDPTVDSYTARTDGNVATEATKTANNLKAAWQETFAIITPDLIKFLHHVNGLIEMFDHLSPGVKKNVAEFAIFGTAITGVLGVFGIFIGNAIKGVGVLIQIGSAVAEAVGGFLELAPVAAAISTGFEVVSAAAAAVAGAISLPVVAIAALVAAVVGLAIGWQRDWFGIREKTATVISWLGQEIPKIPQQLGHALGLGLSYLVDFTAKWVVFWVTLPKRAVDGVLAIAGAIRDHGGEWAKTGMEMIGKFFASVWQGIKDWEPKIVGAIGGVLHALNPATWISAGVGMAKNFVDGAVKGYQDGTPRIKQAQQKIRDLHPGSEPKDSTSPLYGMGASGRAMSDMFVQGVIDGLIAGGPKIKAAHAKHTKPHKQPNDMVIVLRANETIKEVETAAAMISAALAKAHAKTKQGWIDLFAPDGTLTRVHGNQTAFTIAKGHVAALNAAKKQHDAMESRTNKQFFGKDQNGKEGSVGRTNTDFEKMSADLSKFDTVQAKFDARLQTHIQMRKNQELPTVKELNAERQIEISEKQALDSIMTQEERQRSKLLNDLSTLDIQISKLNDKDATQHKLKQQLLATQALYRDQLVDLNDKLDMQHITLDKLNVSIKDYDKNIADAINGTSAFAKVLDEAFQKAAKSALDHLGTTLVNGLDHLFNSIFGHWGNSNSFGGLIKQTIGDFVGSFVSDVAHSVVDNAVKQAEKGASDWLKGMGSKLLGGSTSSASHDAIDAATKAGHGTSAADAGSNKIVSAIENLANKNPVAAGTVIIMAGAAGLGSMIGGLESGGGPGNTHKTWGAAGAALGAGGMAAIGLSTAYAGAMLTGGSTALMPLLASLGPAGWAMILGGALLGGAAGGLFGHKDVVENMPDKYRTADFGQFMANVGTANDHATSTTDQIANGQHFNIDPTVSSATGGKGEGAFISEQIAKMSDAQGQQTFGSDWAKVKAMFTGWSGQNEHLHDGKLNGYGWEDVNSTATLAMQKLTTSANAAASALLQNQQNADALAASFTSLLLNGPSGFNFPAFLGADKSDNHAPWRGFPGEITKPLVTPGGDGGNGKGGPVQPPVVHIRILEGAQVGSSADLLDQLRAALPQMENELSAVVSRAYYKRSRLQGDYISAV